MTSNYASLHDPNFQRVETPHPMSDAQIVNIKYIRYCYFLSITAFFLTWGIAFKGLSTSQTGRLRSMIGDNKALMYFVPFCFGCLVQKGVTSIFKLKH